MFFDDLGSVFIVIESISRNGLAAIASFLLADVQPLLNCMFDGANIGVRRRIGGARTCVFSECERLFPRAKGFAGVARFGGFTRVPHLVRSTFFASSF